MIRAKIKRIWKYILEELALFSAELFLIVLVGVGCLVLFVNIGYLLNRPLVASFDNYIVRVVRSIASPAMDKVMKAITFMNNVEFIIFAFLAVLIYFLFIKPHRWFSIKVPVVSVGSISLNLLLKNYYERPRPDILGRMVEANDFSFPSGHSMFSISFYGLLIYIIWKQTKGNLRVILATFITMLIIFIGISRIYLRVHYPSDVLGGFAAGLTWLLLSVGVLRMIENRIHKKIDKPAAEPFVEE